MKFEQKILNLAKYNAKVIVFPEAEYSVRVQEAIKIIVKSKIANVIAIGSEKLVSVLGKFASQVTIYNYKTFAHTSKLVSTLYEKRKNKGLTEQQAKILIQDNIYFATMLVECGYADGMVCGAENSTADTLRPALQIIKASKEYSLVSSGIFVLNKKYKQPLYFADVALNKYPNAQQLKEITLQSVATFKQFCNNSPNVAMLSFSTNGSGEGESVNIVKESINLIKSSVTDLKIDGEMQADCALEKEVAFVKFPNSTVAGKSNILIFPNLDSANIGYKLFKVSSNATVIGPIIQGLNKPVNDLSRGCSIKEIVLLTAITVLQCKN